jgi:AcrR family transcriptional regulator
MPERIYSSPGRDAMAAETRARLLEAAGLLLRQASDPSKVSLDAVAKAAGVTRLTVYNQFASRRGLLEAVFDEIARLGGLHRIPAAMALPDPIAALYRLLDIFCDFWASDHALGRLHAAAAADAEFALAMAERQERRRRILGVLVQRLVAAGAVNKARTAEIVDMLFALSSYAMFDMLCQPGRKPAAVRRMLKSTFTATLESGRNDSERGKGQ